MFSEFSRMRKELEKNIKEQNNNSKKKSHVKANLIDMAKL